MSELKKIKGYWNTSFNDEFNENDMWEGSILSEEDGWFEGIVVDPNSSYIGDRFIFGVYFPGRVFELYKFTPINISAPFVFHAKQDCLGYTGTLEEIGLFGPYPFGACHFRVTSMDVNDNTAEQKVIEEEKKKLQERIQEYKDNTMDYVGREFYNNAIAQRKSLCKIIIANYEGRKFTSDEVKEIKEECDPITEKIINSTVDEAEKIAKKYIYTPSHDEGELPFEI